jgi:hypothetical protein
MQVKRQATINFACKDGVTMLWKSVDRGSHIYLLEEGVFDELLLQVQYKY